MLEMNMKSLRNALSNMFGEVVVDATFETERFDGGDVGAVYKITGKAAKVDGTMPYTLVLKVQKKWERPGDPECWRREFDIYQSGLMESMPPSLKMPRAYLLEESENQTQIWMEYVDGANGTAQLTGLDELIRVAQRLGQFQAEFHRAGKLDVACLRPFPAVESSFARWYGYVEDVLGAPIEGFPEELRALLLNYAARAEDVMASLKKLPVTLCHGDAWVNNIFLKNDDVYLIDWDCAGYGYMGEDLIDLLVDETFVDGELSANELPRYRHALFEAYCVGARKGGMIFSMNDADMRNIFALAWGYRVLCHFLHADDGQRKQCYVEILKYMLSAT